MAGKVPHCDDLAQNLSEQLDWQDLQVFLEIVERGSIRAAAKRFSSHQSTIARRLKKLELAVGKELITRNTAGQPVRNLTEDGQRILRLAQLMRKSVEHYITDLHVS